MPPPSHRQNPPTSIDLFAGAGGLLLGLAEAGFDASLAVDDWKPAVDSLRANFDGLAVLDDDVGTLSGREVLDAANLAGPPTLVAGGPPCQGFSSAGARKDGDKRNTLVSKFGNLIAELGPPAFIFENVEGFLTAEGGSRVTDLLDPVLEAGYSVHLKKINAANYGVPQHRKRVIAIGTLASEPPFPAPTHYAFGAPGAHRAGANGMPSAPTLDDAVARLPSAGTTDAPDDHVARAPNGIDRQRIAALAEGQTMRDLPDALQHPSYRRRAFRRVMDGTPSERRGGAPAGLRRLVAKEPSKAITGAAPRELIHPTEDRPLTLRECARIQTFPDWFTFTGTVSERALLIGNAVPPRLALGLGCSLIKWLATTDRVPSESTYGRLVTFEPTASTGMSPALQAIARMVRERYGGRTQEALWA